MDKRAFSETPLVPTYPLPHISRRALARISDPVAIPTECRYCGSPVHLVDNAEIYGGFSRGEWHYVYACTDCDAYVGVHPNTDIPLGTLANTHLRACRRIGKQAFIDLIKTKKLPRKEAYAWLAERLAIQESECHWAMFESDRCLLASQICKDAMPNPA